MPRIKLIVRPHKTPTGLLAVVLMLMIAANVASAQTTALKARVILRPVTTGDISRNKLPSTTETSPGLINVAIGTGAYLEADVNAAIPAADITAVTWALTS